MKRRDANAGRVSDIPGTDLGEPTVADLVFDDGTNEAARLKGSARKPSLPSWAKKNPNVTKAFAAGGLVSLVALVVGWRLDWFDAPAPPTVSSPQAEREVMPPDATSPAPAPNPALVKSPPASSPVVATPSPLATPAAVATTQPILQPLTANGSVGVPSATNDKAGSSLPPLPDDVRRWAKADYYRARRENHPNLVAAIRYLGQAYVGGASAGQVLADLLKPLPTAAVESPPGGQPAVIATPYGTTTNAPGKAMVEALIEALARNGSEVARRTLEQVLSGEFTTEDDKVAVETAMKMLLAYPSPVGDALLVRAIAAEEELRPGERQGVWAAKEMQAKALELAKVAAGYELRVKLAEALIARTVKPDPKEPAVEFLLTSEPRNCGAQVVLYERTELPSETKSLLEQQLLTYSAKALAKSLAIPDEISPGSSAGGTLSMVAAPLTVGPASGSSVESLPSTVGASTNQTGADPLWHAACELWSKQCREAWEPRLRRVSTLEKQPYCVLLGATIPCDSTRAVLLRTLKSHWSEGPKALETAGILDRVCTDPGLLVTLKSNPRREAKSARSGGRQGLAGSSGGGPKFPESLQKKVQAEQDWMELSSKLVAAWCKRLSAAAEAKVKHAPTGANTKARDDHSPEGNRQDDEAGKAASEDVKLPAGFAMHPDAHVSAQFHLHWPASAPAELAKLKLDWLDVHYVRAVQRAKPKKATAYYARQAQAKPSDIRAIEKVTWIDVLRIGSEKDRKRSVDVRITREDAGGEKTDADAETALTIEVLMIEVKDPTKD